MRGQRYTTLADIAAHAGLAKATAHRILAGLARRGYVDAYERGRYGPGPQTFVLAGMANAVHDYAAIAGPAVRELRAHTSDTIHIALRVGDVAVYIDKSEGKRAYNSASKVGFPLPLHCTAIGKAILAALSGPDLDELLGRLPLVRRTPRTITDPSALRRELAATRARGFALDEEENEATIRCVGAAFRDFRGRVLGAISVSGPTFMISTEEAIALGPCVAGAAASITAALGGTADGSATVSLRGRARQEVR